MSYSDVLGSVTEQKMTDDELKALMRATMTEGYPSDVRRLIEAVQAAERERCAKACEAEAENWRNRPAPEATADPAG